ncbi:hypothetical protein METBIDRAFT_14022 [Metschnikowia bicuspidata var. bicuspidata NRRL YB-4993]|uniref:Uncharacterized protein n=1 Tax=Metschnikowia bicuspidata var. bicuspidata NRRL YB-4993 TaxID=869754 RepID=A0A1A0GZ28_9ASCO|nr:hypothetical protein METBIDRAFT_14022 [Metschnikowia bicuspidata var. bicuspidata NRRL YB-4993]OBA17029.1 hypothetical protein METBIDRAFT_14022 [Metschnikowia bicuspidata var. bicuspidata NRRL YB-4993]
MRSILKSHKRNDSSASDPSSQLDPPFTKASVTRSNGPPILHQTVEMTPPMSASGFHQLAMSSPKKLLTPIKKMFGHHSKPTAAPQATETLQSLILGDLEPPRSHKFSRQKKNPVTDATESHNSDSSTSQHPTLLATLSTYSNSGLHQPVKNLTKLDDKAILWRDKSHGSSKPDDLWSGSQASATMPIITLNPSDVSISTSKNSLILSPDKDNSFSKAVKGEDSSGAENDLKDSDDSSQFSFMKDIRGGRNTSVKYYKTKLNTGAADGILLNYFNIDDMRVDAEAFSDYDFENNGLSDENDFDDGFTENNNRYGDFVSDYTTNRVVQDPAANESLLFRSPINNLARSPSTGCSIEYANERLEDLPLSPRRSPGYAGDFFDTYLESRLPVNIIDSTQSRDNLHRSDSSQNGSEVGLGLGIALQESHLNESSSTHSGMNIMDALRKLEDSTYHDNTGVPSPRESKSELGIETTDFQCNMLEPSASEVTEYPSSKSRGEQRKSVAEMMAILARLDNPPETYSQVPRDTITTAETTCLPSDHKKRYSWFSNDDSFEQSDITHHRISGDTYAKAPLDDDLLDEVNLVPENFDFDKMQNHLLVASEAPAFLRSNSYSKKPQKIVTDNSYHETKIDFQNKVVTFYRSKSLGTERQRTQIPAKAASLRSITSFNDEDISEGDEEVYSEPQALIETRLNYLSRDTPDLLPQKSASLEPINEYNTSRTS